MTFLRMETSKLLHWANLASFLCRPTAIEWGYLSVPEADIKKEVVIENNKFAAKKEVADKKIQDKKLPEDNEKNEFIKVKNKLGAVSPAISRKE